MISELVAAVTSGQMVVFPSEVIAQHWRHYALLNGECGSVWTDTILAWDTFGREHLGAQVRDALQSATRASSASAADGLAGAYDGRQAANMITRLLFAATLDGSDPRLRPLYRRLSASTQNTPLLIAKMSALLPKLAYLIAHSRLAADRPLSRALRTLQQRYLRFLAESDRYELLAEQPPRLPSQSLTICFAQLITEFPLVADRLGDAVAQHIAVPDHYAAIHTVSYATVYEEVRSTAQRIRALLLSGVDPANIAVTVAQLADLHDIVTAIFSRYQIPCHTHKSRPLTDYPFGALVQLMARAVSYDFSHRVLVELCTHPQCVWNSSARELLGIDGQKIATTPRMYQAFPPELYRTIRDIVHTHSFGELRIKLAQFVSVYLERSAWGQTGEQAFTYALELLQWIDAEARLSAPDTPDPFGFYLMALQQSRYAPKAHLSAVAIYDYPVSGGICPAHHFLLNMSQQAVTVLQCNWHMFSDQFRRRYQLDDENITVPTLRLYSHSGAAVYGSYSRLGTVGTATPSLLFLQAPPAGDPPPLASDRFVLPADQRAAAYLRHHTPPQGTSFQVAAIQSATVRHAVQQAFPPDPAGGGVTITHGMLTAFMRCPYRFYLEYVLRISDYPHHYVDHTARRIGTLQHHIMKVLYQHLDRDIPLGRAVDTVDISPLIADVLTAATVAPLERHLTFATVRDQCAAAFTAIATAYPLCRVYAVEKSCMAVGHEYTLSGTIDLLLYDDHADRYILIDYKRKKPTGDRRQRLRHDLQLPFYSELLARSGISITAARHYFFKEAMLARSPATKHADTPDAALLYAAEREQIQYSCDELIRRVRAADFSRADPAPVCIDCPYRELCRGTFTT